MTCGARSVVALSLVAALVAGTAAASATAELRKVDLIAFPLAAAAPLFVAADQGFYLREGLDVRLTETADSAQLVEGLKSGRYQLAAALVDNFVAYEAGQHSVPRQPDRRLAIAMGLSTTSVALIARPELTTIAAIRDQRVGIDAPGTGFALLLYRLLESAGLAAADVKLVRSGSTAKRYAALLAGEIDATMLSPDFAALAVAKGFSVLGDSRAVVGRYLGVGIGVERGWAQANPDILRRFKRATNAATAWLSAGDNRAAAAAILSRRLNVPAPAAATELERMIRNRDLSRSGRVDRAGLKTVLEVRAQYGLPRTKLAPLNAYLLR